MVLFLNDKNYFYTFFSGGMFLLYNNLCVCVGGGGEECSYYTICECVCVGGGGGGGFRGGGKKQGHSKSLINFCNDPEYLGQHTCAVLSLLGCQMQPAVNMDQVRRGKGGNFPYFSFKTYVVNHHWNPFTETVLMRGHNLCFR